jgi:hypothetical protein
MTLQETAWLAQIVSGAFSIVFVGIMAMVAVSVYRWHRQNAKIETTRRISEDMRHYNQLVLASDELQALAIETHRWGTLTKEEVIRMYRYFIYLNISVSAYQARLRSAIDEPDYESVMNNTANITFNDRAFIKQHVLPRGYSKKSEMNSYKDGDELTRTEHYRPHDAQPVAPADAGGSAGASESPCPARLSMDVRRHNRRCR